MHIYAEYEDGTELTFDWTIDHCPMIGDTINHHGAIHRVLGRRFEDKNGAISVVLIISKSGA